MDVVKRLRDTKSIFKGGNVETTSFAKVANHQHNFEYGDEHPTLVFLGGQGKKNSDTKNLK